MSYLQKNVKQEECHFDQREKSRVLTTDGKPNEAGEMLRLRSA